MPPSVTITLERQALLPSRAYNARLTSSSTPLGNTMHPTLATIISCITALPAIVHARHPSGPFTRDALLVGHAIRKHFLGTFAGDACSQHYYYDTIMPPSILSALSNIPTQVYAEVPIFTLMDTWRLIRPSLPPVIAMLIRPFVTVLYTFINTIAASMCYFDC